MRRDGSVESRHEGRRPPTFGPPSGAFERRRYRCRWARPTKNHAAASGSLVLATRIALPDCAGSDCAPRRPNPPTADEGRRGFFPSGRTRGRSRRSARRCPRPPRGCFAYDVTREKSKCRGTQCRIVGRFLPRHGAMSRGRPDEDGRGRRPRRDAVDVPDHIGVVIGGGQGRLPCWPPVVSAHAHDSVKNQASFWLSSAPGNLLVPVVVMSQGPRRRSPDRIHPPSTAPGRS